MKKKSIKNTLVLKSLKSSSSVIDSSSQTYLESFRLANRLENNEKNKNQAEKIALEAVLDLDRLKSFESYFPEDNIEMVLKIIKREKLGNLIMKSTKNIPNRKEKYELFLKNVNRKKKQNLENIMEEKQEKDFLSTLSNPNSPFQRKFFKTKNNLEKQMREEEFDQEKIKTFFREKFQKKKEAGGGKLTKIANFFFKNDKKKISLVKIKGNFKPIAQK